MSSLKWLIVKDDPQYFLCHVWQNDPQFLKGIHSNVLHYNDIHPLSEHQPQLDPCVHRVLLGSVFTSMNDCI